MSAHECASGAGDSCVCGAGTATLEQLRARYELARSRAARAHDEEWERRRAWLAADPEPLAVVLVDVERDAWRARVNQQGLAATVARARDAGASWSQIAAQLGVSKQAAQQRYGRRETS